MAVFTSSLRFVLNSGFEFMPKPIVTVYPPSGFDPTGIGYWSDTLFATVKDVFYCTGAPVYNNDVVTGTLSTLVFTADATFNGTGTGSWSLNLGTGTVDAGAVHEAVMTGQGAANLFVDMLAGNDTITLSEFNDVFLSFDGDDVLWGGNGNDRLNGGKGLDELNGEAGNDTLVGGPGRDRINGGESRDTLRGDAGSDILTGGAGRDTMTGGIGADSFAFKYVTESGAGDAARDTITDFEVAAGTGSTFLDRIDLELIDARYHRIGNEAFKFIGGTEFSAEGQVRVEQVGADTWVEVNTRGAGTAEMIVVLTNFTASNITQYDFIL